MADLQEREPGGFDPFFVQRQREVNSAGSSLDVSCFGKESCTRQMIVIGEVCIR